MNKIFTKIATACAGLAMAIGVGVAIGNNANVVPARADYATGRINFGSATGKTNVTSSPKTGDDSLGNTWTVTTVGTTSFTANADYSQIGSKSAAASSITFTTTLPAAQTISSFAAKFGGFSGTAGSVTLKVGDNTVGTGSLNGTSDVTVTANDATKSGTVLTVTVTGISKGVKAYYIEYQYNSGGQTDERFDVELTVAGANNATSVYVGETLALNVSATADGEDAGELTYTFTSNKTSVATVSNTGVITGVAAGKATITVNYAGDDYYKPAEATFEVQVLEHVVHYVDDETAKTITWDMTKASYMSMGEEAAQWDSPKATMDAAKSTAGTATNNYCPPTQNSTRLYKNSTLTIAPKTGFAIQSITFTTGSDNYATALRTSTWTNATAAAGSETNVVIVTPASKSAEVMAKIGNICGLISVVVNYSTAVNLQTRVLASENLAMSYGDADVTPVVKVQGTNTVVSGCTFTSSDTKVATIVEGKIHAAGKGTATITAAHVDDETYTYTPATFTVTVTKINTIESLYGLSDKTQVEFYGYYAGEFSDGVVVMDGHFGMILYKAATKEGWTIDETVLHVTGSMKTYNGLVEVNEPKVDTDNIPASEVAKLSKPINYSLIGNEATSATADIANRRTFVTGKLTAIEAKTSKDKTNYDITVNDGKTDLALYLKDADNVEITLKDNTKKTIAAYLQDMVNKEVTIKGFTSFYNAFQVRVYDIVESDNTYTAEQFAQQLLDETDTVCESWDGHADNTSALTSIWNNLGGAERWQALTTEERARFTSANANYDNNSENVLENAAGRYNMICKKYGFNNFASRTNVNEAPVSPLHSNSSFYGFGNSADNEMITVIVVMAALATICAGGFFFYRRRKEQQ